MQQASNDLLHVAERSTLAAMQQSYDGPFTDDDALALSRDFRAAASLAELYAGRRVREALEDVLRVLYSFVDEPQSDLRLGRLEQALDALRGRMTDELRAPWRAWLARR